MTDLLSVHGLPFLACLVMLAILSYVGIHVLKREIIFIDIALAQIAAVGAVAAHVVFHFHGDSIYAHALAFGATVVAAAFFAVVRRAVVQIPLEAVIGVCYAVSAAAALFVIGVAPGGHVHVQGMLAGSVLWATWADVLWSGAAFALVGLCFRIFRTPFRAISEDYNAASAAGYNTRAWDFFFYALVGIVVTVAVRIAGVVLVFAFLIVPATLSAVFTAGWTGRLFIAWGMGAVSTIVGLSFADRYDFSVGPAIALFLGLALVVIGMLRLWRVTKALSAGAWLTTAVVLGVWFTAGPSPRDARPLARPGAMPDVGSTRQSPSHIEESRSSGGVEFGSIEVTPEKLAAITRVEQIEKLIATVTDDDERAAVVCRWLEINARSGADAAINFLSGDPPLLFRSMVVDKLQEAAGREVGYDVGQPFSAASNQNAVAELKRTLRLE